VHAFCLFEIIVEEAICGSIAVFFRGTWFLKWLKYNAAGKVPVQSASQFQNVGLNSH
jgi:hypothetical protein